MPLLDRNAILTVQDLKTEDVSVPEWGGDVRVRTLTGTERDKLREAMRGEDGKIDPINYQAKLLSRTLVGEDGNLLFSEADLHALASKSTIALERVFVVADKLNTLGPGAIPAAEKN